MVTIVEDAQPNLSVGERVVTAKRWTRMLEDIIPVLELQETLVHAFKIHDSSFPINHYDLKKAFADLKEVRAREREKAHAADSLREVNAISNCKSKHAHIERDGEPDHGEILHWNWVNPNEDWIAPCFECRPKAYRLWRERMVEKHRPPPEPLFALTNVLSFKKPERRAEVYLSANDVAELLEEHNRLVEKITDDETARRNLILVFDEGANIFKLPHRADLTYSAEVLRAKIADYRKILESRNVEQ